MVDVVVGGAGVAVITVKVTVWLVIPFKLAVILVLPMATPVAVPEAETVAMVGSELVQVTREEINSFLDTKKASDNINIWPGNKYQAEI